MYDQLKAKINQYIRTNGVRAITGAILNEVLNDMVDGLGTNAGFGGSITPSSEAPTTDSNIFFIASTAGTYTNFSGIVVASGELAFIHRQGNGWAKDSWTISVPDISGKADKVDTPNVIHLDNYEHSFDTLTDEQVAGLRVGDIIEWVDINGGENTSYSFVVYTIDENDVVHLMEVGINGIILLYKLVKNGDYWELSDGDGSIDISGKADKVSNATSGNFAGLDENGNLTDSGSKESDFATPSDIDTAFENYSPTFVCSYGVTTYSDIIDAYESGKRVVVDRSGRISELSFVLNNRDCRFFRIHTDNTNHITIKKTTVTPNNEWREEDIKPEDITDKVSTIAGYESDTTKYPNTKAVYDFVKALADANNLTMP